ncbi:MDC1 protein, partial [Scytalopus superciliaris]|nr:MDC1 protein [Scytalopus superciliaris]
SEVPDPDVSGPTPQHWALVVDSDTDVEEEGPDPDVPPPKRPKITPKVLKIPDVGTVTTNPDVERSQVGLGGPVSDPDVEDEEGPDPDVATQLFLPDSDVEAEKANPDVGHPRGPQMAPEFPETSDVGAEPPDPDVGHPKPPQNDPDGVDGGCVGRGQRYGRGFGNGAWPRGYVQTFGWGRGQGCEGVPFGKGAWPKGCVRCSGKGAWSHQLAPPPQEEEAGPAGGTKRRLRPRGVPGPAHIRVLFTGVVASPALEAALGTLGGVVASSVHDCTHLVTDGVRRTLKFLCALARGIPIVTPQWLLQCPHTSLGVPRVSPAVPTPPQAAPGDIPRVSPMSPWCSQGYEIHVTPSVQPGPEDMKDIVTCCGGTFLPSLPRGHRVSEGTLG